METKSLYEQVFGEQAGDGKFQNAIETRIAAKAKRLHLMTNDFHNTQAWTKYSPEQRYEIDERIAQGTATDAEKQARRRAHNILCGSPTCTCGNSWGER